MTKTTATTTTSASTTISSIFSTYDDEIYTYCRILVVKGRKLTVIVPRSVGVFSLDMKTYENKVDFHKLGKAVDAICNTSPTHLSHLYHHHHQSQLAYHYDDETCVQQPLYIHYHMIG